MKGHTNSASGTKAISNPNVCAITVEYPQGCSCILRQDTREFTAPSGGTSYMFYVDYGTWEAVCSDGTFEYKDSVTVDYGQSAKLILGKFLILESPSSFTLTPGDGTVAGKDGTLEYSVNGDTWTEWNELSVLTAGAFHSKYVLYLRGTGNTTLTGTSGSVGEKGWHLTGSNVTVKGNIATLLDWSTVANGALPSISAGAFCYLFGHDTNNHGTALQYAHELVIPYTTLPGHVCRYMFRAQDSLMTSPKLPATSVGDYTYGAMFNKVPKLVVAPALPATNLGNSCYKAMFEECTGLLTLPELPATTLPTSCYERMFKSDTQIALSTSLEASGYKYQYYIPADGSVVSAGESATYEMFISTGGTFTGTPSTETRYTTTNEIITV